MPWKLKDRRIQLVTDSTYKDAADSSASLPSLTMMRLWSYNRIMSDNKASQVSYVDLEVISPKLYAMRNLVLRPDCLECTPIWASPYFCGGLLTVWDIGLHLKTPIPDNYLEGPQHKSRAFAGHLAWGKRHANTPKWACRGQRWWFTRNFASIVQQASISYHLEFLKTSDEVQRGLKL